MSVIAVSWQLQYREALRCLRPSDLWLSGSMPPSSQICAGFVRCASPLPGYERLRTRGRSVLSMSSASASTCPRPGLSRRVVGQPGGRSLRAVVERNGWHHGPRYEPRGSVLDHWQPRRRHAGPIRGVGRCWAGSRGLEDIRWAANDRGVAAFPGALTNGEGRLLRG